MDSAIDTFADTEPTREIEPIRKETNDSDITNESSANERSELSANQRPELSSNEKTGISANSKEEAVEIDGGAESTISVERLYELCEILDAANLSSLTEGAVEFEDKFKELLTGVKGEKKQKQLACQFIMRFFKHFRQNCLELTLDALFDLCEDMDASIRRQAIKELPNVCKEVPSTVARISDILAQLLQAEDTIEYAVVQTSLLHLVKIDAKQCLLALFSQILTATHTGRSIHIFFWKNLGKNSF